MTMMMWRATLSLVEVWGFWTVVLVLVERIMLVLNLDMVGTEMESVAVAGVYYCYYQHYFQWNYWS